GWGGGPFSRSLIGLGLAFALTQLKQQLPYPPCGAQLAGDVGCQTQIALGVEPAGLDIRRQLAHRFGECREDLLDFACSEPPFPGHARRLPLARRRDQYSATEIPSDPFWR